MAAVGAIRRSSRSGRIEDEVKVPEEEYFMKTLTLQATIGPNGTIHLDIPSDLPPGPAEVKVTIQPVATKSHSPWGGISTEAELVASLDVTTPEADPEAPSRFCSGLFLGRLPEDYDIDAAIDEMNAQWKAKLEHLKVEP
jgi:hypothetical protein